MRTRALAATVFAVFLAAACRTTPPDVASTPVPIAPFALVLEQSETGWAAHCETGCQWRDVSMTCAGCDVRLDASGIARATPSAPEATGFAFVLSRAERGWTAQGIQGVQWQSLSWNCGAAACRARLDESGVAQH